MASDIAVGFDFDHTLGIDNKLERTVALEILARLAAERGVAYDAAEASRAMDETLASYRAGREAVETGVAGFLVRFVPGLGRAAVDEAQSFREAVVERVPEFVTALPQAQEMLDALDTLGIPYAILSNGWSPLQEEKARAIGFRGPVFVSERIGERKPARAAFESLAAHFDRRRASACGTSATIPRPTPSGALAAGMQSVWFDWEGRTYPQDAPRPNHVIHGLGELAPLLQGRSDAAANRRRMTDRSA